MKVTKNHDVFILLNLLHLLSDKDFRMSILKNAAKLQASIRRQFIKIFPKGSLLRKLRRNINLSEPIQPEKLLSAFFTAEPKISILQKGMQPLLRTKHPEGIWERIRKWRKKQ